MLALGQRFDREARTVESGERHQSSFYSATMKIHAAQLSRRFWSFADARQIRLNR
jgi:hypothetical protein